MAQASTQALSKHALKESEVLCPLPLELSDLPAGFAPEEPADHILPPGAGLVECPRPVLRSTGGPRPSDIFRTLSSLFWDTKAPEQKPDSAPRGAPLPNCAKDGAWRRALRTAPTSTREMPEHPLLTAEHATTPKRASRFEPLPLPGPGGIATWDEVDEVVHRAFNEGQSTDRALELNLADLVANLSQITGPDSFGDSDGLPPSPCRGLARLECLTPRPFYLPNQEAAKAWLNVHAPAPEERTPGSRTPNSRSGPRSEDPEEGADGSVEDKAAEPDEADSAVPPQATASEDLADGPVADKDLGEGPPEAEGGAGAEATSPSSAEAPGEAAAAPAAEGDPTASADAGAASDSASKSGEGAGSGSAEAPDPTEAELTTAEAKKLQHSKDEEDGADPPAESVQPATAPAEGAAEQTLAEHAGTATVDSDEAPEEERAAVAADDR